MLCQKCETFLDYQHAWCGKCLEQMVAEISQERDQARHDLDVMREWKEETFLLVNMLANTEADLQQRTSERDAAQQMIKDGLLAHAMQRGEIMRSWARRAAAFLRPMTMED